MVALHSEVIRRGSREIPLRKDEIRLFAVMRDEMLRLPYFVNYYRQAGVDRFFFIDNKSVDGSAEFILNQPDCHLFYTEGSYGNSRAGVDWLNSLLGMYGQGHWILLADIDEIFVYPSCETAGLANFCSWLDSCGHEAVYTILLDMYSELPIREVKYHQGEDFRIACPFYDKDYSLVPRYGIPGIFPAFPPFEHIGGPRPRLCFPRQNTAAVWPRIKPKLARRLMTMFQKVGFLRNAEPPVAATQTFKVPLVKWRRNFAFVTSHRLNRVTLSPVTGAMLHFKYFQDFGKRIDDALASGEHYMGSSEYRLYAKLLASNSNLSLLYERSAPYSTSDDLIHSGLVKTTGPWDRYCDNVRIRASARLAPPA